MSRSQGVRTRVVLLKVTQTTTCGSFALKPVIKRYVKASKTQEAGINFAADFLLSKRFIFP